MEIILIPCITGAIVTVLGIVVKKIIDAVNDERRKRDIYEKKQKEQEEIHRLLLCVLVRAFISHDHREYTQKKYITTGTLGILCEMHGLYKQVLDANGKPMNGYADIMFDALTKLRIIDADGEVRFLEELIATGREGQG